MTQIFSPKEAAVITEAVRKAREDLNEKFSHISWLMVGVVLVTFVAFLTMLGTVAALVWQSLTFKQSTYQDLVNQVRTQNESINKSIDIQQQELNILLKLQAGNPNQIKK